MAELQAAYPELSTRRLCALLGLSRSWWHARARPREPDAEAVALRAAIEQIVLDFPGSGYRRVTHPLRRDGWTINAKRVVRVMREASVLCQRNRRFAPTTDSRHGLGRSPHRLAARVLSGPDQAWGADSTSIRLPTTFCSLAALLDACSRRCVGWELSRTIDTELTLAALERAVASRQPAPGLIHRPDHGVQSASTRSVARLETIGAQVGMAAVGNAYENALAESFFATRKREEVYVHEDRTVAAAAANLARFLDDVYNHKRLHSSLGYRPPSEFEALWTDERADDDFSKARTTLSLAVVR